MQNVLIISDLHLTHRYDKKKSDFLLNLISKYDLVIINGDLWCNYLSTFDELLNSKYKQLFSKLQPKTIYLYGNHDRKQYMDNRMNLVSKEHNEEYRLQVKDKILIIKHGHQFYKLAIPSENHINYKRKIRYESLLNFIQNITLNILGKNTYYKPGKKLNKRAKEWAIKNLDDNEILVMGHTHAPEMDLKNKYINCGYVNFGEACYISIINNNIELKCERY